MLHHILTFAMDGGNQIVLHPVNSPWCCLCRRLSILHRGGHYRESNRGLSPRSLVMVPVLLVETIRENTEFKHMCLYFWLHSQHTISVTCVVVALNIALIDASLFQAVIKNDVAFSNDVFFLRFRTIFCRLLLPAVILSLARLLLQTSFRVPLHSSCSYCWRVWKGFITKCLAQAQLTFITAFVARCHSSC